MTSQVIDLSPQKKLLNFEQFSPVKVLVGCEINGWFETKKKSPMPQRKRPPRYIHCRFNADKKLRQMNKSKHQSPNKVNFFSISKLKDEIDTITSTKVKLNQLSTNCKTQSQTRTEDRKQSRIPIIDVNIRSFEDIICQQSIQQKKPIKQVEHYFHLNQIQFRPYPNKLNPGPITQRMQQQRIRMDKILSYNKIKSNEKQQLQSHITRRLSLINQSQQIIKGNLSTNQKRTLNLIANFNLPVDNNGKRQNTPGENLLMRQSGSNYSKYRVNKCAVF